MNTSCCGDDLAGSDDDGKEHVWTAEEDVGSEDDRKENVVPSEMLRLILTAEVEEKHVMCT